MPSTIDTRNQLRPDIDLTDGAFYAGNSRPVYQWMRENEPVFRDRNGLIGADETTRHTLSGGTAQILGHPRQHRQLVDDVALLSNAIEEMLRWTARSKIWPAP